MRGSYKYHTRILSHVVLLTNTVHLEDILGMLSLVVLNPLTTTTTAGYIY